MLVLRYSVLDVLPLSCAALRNEALLRRGLRLNLLDELGYELINGVLVVLVGEDVEDGARLDLGEAVVRQRTLFVPLEVDDELVLLAVKFLFKLLAEGLELVRDALEGLLLFSAHLRIDVVDGGDEGTASRFNSLLQGHLNVEQVTLQRLYQLEELGLIDVVFDGPARVLHIGPLPVDLTVDVLLRLLVHLDLADGLDLGVTLRLAHLFLAEGQDLLLLLLLVLDVVLELADGVLDVWLRVLDHLLELDEARYLVIIVERLHAVIEQVHGVVDVSLLKSLVCLL